MAHKAATARGRTLGGELRDVRKATGLTTRAAATRIGWTATMLNRTENGHRAASAEDVATILGAYGVVGSERERLLNLARDAENPGWWETGDSIFPAPVKALIGFEAQAVRISSVELNLIPGLLQTPAYARAIMRAAGVGPLEIETRVAMRLGRQAILTRPDPPRVLTILDETALIRPVGGAAVMAEQLRHLQHFAERKVAIRVLPLRLGAHPALTGPFTILGFGRARTLVHQEGKWSYGFVDTPSDVDPFVACFDTLSEMSLPPARSVDFIASIAAAYER